MLLPAGWELAATLLGMCALGVFTWPFRKPKKGSEPEPKAEAPAPLPPGVRGPIAAGHYYPAEPQKLRQEIASYLGGNGPKTAAVACLVPHDAYTFSGGVTGAVLSRLDLPNRFVILGPSHTATAHPLSLVSRGAWRTPLGDMPIDAELATAIGGRFRTLREDLSAQGREHATEVVLPFLQVLKPGSAFVPICVGSGAFDTWLALGEALASVLRHWRERALIIATTDLNHYESDAITRQKDEKVIESILARDPESLMRAISKHGVSMCGQGATVVMLTAATWMNAQSAELVRYATTAEVSGNAEAVVGYAGIIVN